MRTGMLWLDNSQADLKIKIQKAVDYYEKKYGLKPNLCLVHPTMMHEDMRIEASFVLDGIMVRPYRPVLPGHLWIGIEDKDV